MCTALMDGRAWTVGELGTWAGLARSTAAEHVNLLVGRTCYSHLAGRLGVKLADLFLDRGWLSASWELTDAGRDQLCRWGIPGTVSVQRCMDSTERRFHLAGELRWSLCAAAFDHDWVERVVETRAVRLTAEGREAFAAF